MNTNYIKMDRDEFVTYLDTTPLAGSMNFEVLGVGVTSYGIAFNPQIESEKWIIEKNARNTHESNQKQGDVTQTIYKNDPCYKFIRNGKNKLNNITHILDIDRSEEVSDGEYYAELSDGMYAVTNYMSETANIEYTLYYQGDPKIGTVKFAEGKPVFTEKPVTRALSDVE